MKGHENEDTGTACCIEGCREFLSKKCSISLKQRNYVSDQGQPVFGELEEEITKICSMILASHKKQKSELESPLLYQYGLSYLQYLNGLEKSAYTLRSPSLHTVKGISLA